MNIFLILFSVQKEQLTHIMQTGALSQRPSLFDMFHMLKIESSQVWKRENSLVTHIFQHEHHSSTKNAASKSDLTQAAE